PPTASNFEPRIIIELAGEGWTQEQIAAEFGIQQSWVSRLFPDPEEEDTSSIPGNTACNGEPAKPKKKRKPGQSRSKYDKRRTICRRRDNRHENIGVSLSHLPGHPWEGGSERRIPAFTGTPLNSLLPVHPRSVGRFAGVRSSLVTRFSTHGIAA